MSTYQLMPERQISHSKVQRCCGRTNNSLSVIFLLRIIVNVNLITGSGEGRFIGKDMPRFLVKTRAHTSQETMLKWKHLATGPSYRIRTKSAVCSVSIRTSWTSCCNSEFLADPFLIQQVLVEITDFVPNRSFWQIWAAVWLTFENNIRVFTKIIKY